MASKRLNTCKEQNCDKPLFAARLCEEHFMLQQGEERLRNDAIHLLHHGMIDGTAPTNSDLFTLVKEIRDWWDKACVVVNYNVPDPILGDQAEYAIDWCKALAKEIVITERRSRDNLPPTYDFEFTKGWVLERLKHIASKQTK